jgi:hypothetical protein
MERRIYPILIICVIGVFAACIAVMALTDNEAPAIKIDENGIIQTYADDTPEEDLLKGVSAYDAQEGDVSDSLKIMSVIVINEGENVQITYAAKDSKNNIVQETVKIPYSGNASAGDVVVSADTNKQETTEETTQEETTMEEETTLDPTKVSGGSGEPVTIDQQAVNTSGKPAIELKYTDYTLKVGEAFTTVEALDMVNTTYDDKEAVSNRIVINGLSNVDTKTVGEYLLNYSVSDTEGNKSDIQTLKIHVVE